MLSIDLRVKCLSNGNSGSSDTQPISFLSRTSLALTVYRESIAAGVTPTNEVVSQILGCLQFPYDVSLRSRIIESLGVYADASRRANLCSLVEGFGEYDPRAFSILEVMSIHSLSFPVHDFVYSHNTI